MRKRAECPALGSMRRSLWKRQLAFNDAKSLCQHQLALVLHSMYDDSNEAIERSLAQERTDCTYALHVCDESQRFRRPPAHCNAKCHRSRVSTQMSLASAESANPLY
jgi:hypothetical protein